MIQDAVRRKRRARLVVAFFVTCSLAPAARAEDFLRGDANHDGILNMTDAVYTLLHLFSGGPALPEPYPVAGFDPTPDDFHCVQTGER